MTSMYPRCLTRQSVSPSKSRDAAPVYGTTSKHEELAVEGTSAGEEAAAAPENSGEAKKVIEEEVRKPRVGTADAAHQGGNRRALSAAPELPRMVRALQSRKSTT